jgi:multiple sugar transport system permease protein
MAVASSQARPVAVQATRIQAPRRPNVALFVAAWLLALVFLFPLAWVVLSSLKTNFDALAHPAVLLPGSPQWGNYGDIWRVMNFPRQTFNSAAMAISVTLGQVLLSALAGYAFARLHFVGRDLLFVVILATLIIPFEILFVPVFILLSHWGMINTYAALIIPSLGNPFAIFIFRQFFLTIPRELEEAMFLDGAGIYRTFWSLAMPLSGPAVATVTVLTFLAEWNSLLKPLVFTTSEDMRTLQVGLAFLNSGAFVTEPKIASLMAGVVLSSIPPILVFLLAQERYVKSIVSTGIKG